MFMYNALMQILNTVKEVYCVKRVGDLRRGEEVLEMKGFFFGECDARAMRNKSRFIKTHENM